MASNLKILFSGWEEGKKQAVSISIGDAAAERALEDLSGDPVSLSDVRVRSARGRLGRHGTLYLERGGPESNPFDPKIGRWAMVCLQEHAEALCAAMEPLLRRRRDAGALFMPGGEAPVAGVLPIEKPDSDNPDRWVDALKSVARRKLPHYLFLVGGPSHLPFAFQMTLDVRHATGRLDLPEKEGKIDVSGAAAYAEKVARYEARAALPERHVVLYSFASDPPTKQSHKDLMVPLGEALAKSKFAEGARRTTLFGKDATRAKLRETLLDAAPTLVMTASHGIRAHDRPELWGALTDVDFVGEEGQSPFGVSEVPPSDVPIAPDAVLFCFACFSAGAPKESAYAFLAKKADPVLAPAPLISPLPSALLAHPKGPIAFVGHVDYATSGAFTGPNDREAFTSFAEWVLSQRGTLGEAMVTFRDDAANAAADLAPILTPVPGAPTLTSQRKTMMWIRYHDAVGYLLLGDPAISVR